MKLIIEIDLDNDAFKSDDQTDYAAREEVARILREYSDEITSDFPVTKTLRDTSGNRIGYIRITQ